MGGFRINELAKFLSFAITTTAFATTRTSDCQLLSTARSAVMPPIDASKKAQEQALRQAAAAAAPAAKPGRDWVGICMKLYGGLLVFVILAAIATLPEPGQERERQISRMLDWYCDDETKRTANPVCVAEGIHRWHESEEGREMLDDPYQKKEAQASYDRLKELVEHADYKPSMEAAMRGWCDDLGMLEAGRALCEMWKEKTLEGEL